VTVPVLLPPVAVLGAEVAVVPLLPVVLVDVPAVVPPRAAMAVAAHTSAPGFVVRPRLRVEWRGLRVRWPRRV
jgi:hypothetical protein